MGALKLSAQAESDFLNLEVSDIFNPNIHKTNIIPEFADQYNDSLPSVAGSLNFGAIQLMNCLMVTLKRDLTRIKFSDPDKYLMYLSPMCDSIPVRITRPSMIAMIKKAGKTVCGSTVSRYIDLLIDSGFVTHRRTDRRRYRVIKQDDGTKTIAHKHIKLEADGSHSVVYSEEKALDDSMVRRGEIVVYIAKKHIRFDAKLGKNGQILFFTDYQQFTDTKKKKHSQSSKDYNKKNNIKNNHQNIDGNSKGGRSDQFFEKNELRSCKRKEIHDRSEKNSISNFGGGGKKIGGEMAEKPQPAQNSPRPVQNSPKSPQTKPEIARTIPINTYAQTEYGRQRANIDQIVAHHSPKVKTRQYAHYLYLMINALIYPDNNEYYIQLVEKECVSKIIGMIKMTGLPLDAAFKYISQGVLMAQNWQKKRPDWKYANIKWWLDDQNPYGFEQTILKKWMPKSIYNLGIAKKKSEAKRKAILTHQKANQLAMDVVKIAFDRNSDTGDLMLKHKKRLETYFKTQKTTAKVQASAMKDFMDKTKQVWIMIRAMAKYKNSETYQNLMEKLELTKYL